MNNYKSLGLIKMNIISITDVNLIEEKDLKDNIKKITIFTVGNKHPIVVYIHRTKDCKTRKLKK